MSGIPKGTNNKFKLYRLARIMLEKTVKLLVHNNLAGVMIDRFGKDIMMMPADMEHFTINVDVRVSGPFLGWIISLGEGVKIVGPDEVVDQMRAEIERL